MSMQSLSASSSTAEKVLEQVSQEYSKGSVPQTTVIHPLMVAEV
jgi:hypothetical protein